MQLTNPNPITLMIFELAGKAHGYGQVPLTSILELIFLHSEVLTRYLEILDMPKLKDLPDVVEIQSLINQVENLRMRLGHLNVTELHVLLGLLDLYRSAANSVLYPLRATYKLSNPLGSEEQKFVRQQLLALSPAIPAEIEMILQQTPFDTEVIRTKLQNYLESEFYPYDQISWEKFKDTRLRLWTKQEDISQLTPLHAFFAHGIVKRF